MTRGRKPGPQSAAAANGAKGGRPPQTATLRLGQRLALAAHYPAGMAPLVTGTVTEIKRGLPRLVIIQMDDGAEYRLMI